MQEIKIYGRGGQGVVTAAEVLAVAAFKDGKFSQAFPSFGPERRGAMVTSFARIGNKPIRVRTQVYEPDYVIVQDSTLLSEEGIAKGVKKAMVVNVPNPPTFKVPVEIWIVDATRIALEVFDRPLFNMPMLGAFAAATKELVSLKSIIEALRERFSGKIAEKNVEAIKLSFEGVRQVK